MKKLKINFMMVFALAIGVITMSFKLANNLPTTYYYASESIAEGDFSDVSNWEEGTGNCSSIGNKPCQLEAVDEIELEAMLENKNNSEVLEINPKSRRN